MNSNRHPVNILMILDGWGISDEVNGNAFAQANTPFIDSLLKNFPHCKLSCSGNAVGLPDGTMGNSEVGHMNIGAGRKVPQDFVRINTAIEDRSFFKIPTLIETMTQAAKTGQSLHLMGLLSDGGVHSHISHLFALIEMAKLNKVENLYIHPILDGRDTSPTSGIVYVQQLEDYIKKHKLGKIASIVGRYWAMDRDTRWDRVKRAYDLFTIADRPSLTSAVQAIQEAYDTGKTDEFMEPTCLIDKTLEPAGVIDDGDGIIFFNFRADRAKEITRAFTQKGFSEFTRLKKVSLSHFVCMTQYDETFGLPVAFGTQHLDNILGEILSKNKISQLRIAETEKYAHVTYFFNGGDERIFDLEERIMIPSPRDVATYDEKPQMSAQIVADTVCEKIESRQSQFIILNFANMDMVGHTGILDAAIKACETVDTCVKKVIEAIWKTNGIALVTADHGNCEQMIAPDGTPHTAHTLNPVRLILAPNKTKNGRTNSDQTINDKFKNIIIKDGILGDIAPTILNILNIDQPGEMTGTSLI